MKSFLFKIAILLFVLSIIDYSFGGIMDCVVNKIDVGTTGRDNYICNKANEDILVFGSSRAEHHYNAPMIADSLGMSCYNCGERGSGVVLSYGRLRMLMERHKPKLIIYDINAGYDLMTEFDNNNDLGNLKMHYNRVGIDSIFWHIDPSSRIKMLSGGYRHNSSYLNNIAAFLLRISRSGDGVQGFRPLETKFDSMKIKKDVSLLYDRKKGYSYDKVKFFYMTKFMDMTNDICKVFVVSPVWYGQDSLVLEPIKKMCDSRNILFLDYSNDKRFVHNNDLFQDGTHLNSKGADEFSRDLIYKIQTYLDSSNSPDYSLVTSSD